MKKTGWKFKSILILLSAILVFAACGSTENGTERDISTANRQETQDSTEHRDNQTVPVQYDGVVVDLTDEIITVDGKVISTNEGDAVYAANDIVYYESGKDFTYGEGTEQDAHSQAEAEAHTVVHIAKAGTYIISGTLSHGQIAVDLGDDAENDPNAVVTLILNGVDITCEVAPAIIFYNVYECGNDDSDEATKDVDTSAAGANVIIADGTTNMVRGSYVARIYKPNSVELNKEGTEVVDAKKLHKYDAAFYSCQSMNMNGGPDGTGRLMIHAENEGLDSELHLTINGGDIDICSGNDGINTNEDGVSVTTINGGNLRIQVTGETGEGDGIDSNGWLVINGGTVVAEACSHSADAGVDSDMGIHVNGGTLIATGHMLDHIENGGQTYAVFQFAQEQKGGERIFLKNEEGITAVEFQPENDYSIVVFSSPDLQEGTYTFWSGETQLAGSSGGVTGGFGMPGGMQGGRPGGMPGEMDPNSGFSDPPEGNQGEPPMGGQQPPMGDQQLPEEGERPDKGQNPGSGQRPGNGQGASQQASGEFQIQTGANLFFNVFNLSKM